MLRPFHDILPEGKDTPPPAVRRIALVIGNGRYTAEKDVLDNPANDAKAIAKALTRIGFYGVKPNGDDFAVNFAAPGVPALIDLDQKRLGRALAALERAAPGVSQAVIYYAGHGIEVSGENYLIPIDAKLAHDTDAKYETQPLRRALDAIDGATGLRLVILDACRNNPFRARLFRNRGDGGGLRSIEPPGNVLVAYAAKHGSFASDGKKGTVNSPFAAALLSHIEKPGLEVVDLFREVKDDVLDRTEHLQEPYLYGSLGRRREYFVLPVAVPRPNTAANQAVTAPDVIATIPLDDKELVRKVAGATTPPPWGKIAGGAITAAMLILAVIFWRLNGEVTTAVPSTAPKGFLQTILEKVRPPKNTAAQDAARSAVSNIGSVAEEVKEKTVNMGQKIKDAAAAHLKVQDKNPATFQPEETFHDCEDVVCPEMVVVPAGEFELGSDKKTDPDHASNEEPPTLIKIGKRFGVGKYEVTFDEYDQCVADGTCDHQADDQEWGRGRRPVVDVSWDDAQKYVRYLSKRSGKNYRLLTEAEWEYAARATTSTPYYTGGFITPEQANFNGEDGRDPRSKGIFRRKTIEVGSLPAPNNFGLFDMNGNVWEWVQDCYLETYKSIPKDGSARTSGECSGRVTRGGSWSSFVEFLRSATRFKISASDRSDDKGFRVARDLP